jgi:hypothetical protein
MDEDQFLQSIIANPELTDPSLDVSDIRTTTPTRQEVLADVPEFSGLQFDPTQQSYFEDLYALYSGAIPTIEPPVVTTPTVDTTPVIDTGDMDQATSDSILDTTPTITTPTITQPAGGGADMATVPATTVTTPTDTSITVEDLTQPSNIGDFQITTAAPITNLTGNIPPAPAISPVTTSVNPTTGEVFDAQTGQEIGNLYDEVALTGAQTDSLNALAKASNSIAEFGRKVQETLGGVFDSVDNTIDVFGQKFNVAKTATGLALNAAFRAPVSLAFGLVDQISESLPQSSQVVADVLTQTYGVDDQGRVKGNPATNVFAGMNAVSMFGNVIEAAKERIDNVVDPAKKDLFQKQLDSVQFKVENQISAPQENIGATSIKDTADVEVDLPTSTIDTFRGPTIAEVTDGPTSDDDPAGPLEGPGITADDAFGDDGPSNVGGPPSGPGITSDDAFGDDGPSDASTSDAQAAANREAARESQYQDRSSEGSASSDAAAPSAPSAQDAQRGGQYEGRDSGNGGGGGGGGKIVCTMMNESYGFGSFRNKIWLRHSKNLAPEYQIGYHKIFLPLVKISKTNKIIKKILEHIAVHRTIDIRQESRGKMHILGRVYRKILEPICYWVGKYAKR